MPENPKYYFISFMKYNGMQSVVENSAVDEHPMDWQTWVDERYPGVYKLISWVEIDKKHYDKFDK